jgi:hypothetical protein
MAPDAARAAAASIWTHCFPLVLADLVRRAHPMSFHQFHEVTHDGGNLAPGLAEDDSRVVLTSAWLDLSEEPIVVRLPHTRGRHFSFTVMDTAGEPFESLGSRTGDDSGVDLALVGPDWRGELPSGLRAKRAPSDGVWAVSRIHATSSLDRAEALLIAKRQCLALLRPGREPTKGALPSLDPPASPCLRQVAEITPTTFFHRLEAILDRAPVTYQRSVRPRIEALRASLGGPPDPSQWSPDFSAALAGGFADGLAAIESAVRASAGTDGLEWRAQASGLHNPAMGGLARAARAYASLGAPLRDDLLSFVCDRDESGRPLSGDHGYRIHFARDGLPPVHAFWRLSARPAASYDQRRGIGDRSDLALNADGSVDILIQRLPPAISQIPNWLPSPDGPLLLIMRLYCPRAAVLDDIWRMPPVERLDAGSGVERDARLRARPHPAPARRPDDFRSPMLAWRTIP